MTRPPRLAGFDYLGPHVYLWTFCVANRPAVFNDAALAVRTIQQFRRTARSSSFAIHAYCLMPDHAHLLMEGKTADADFRRFVKSVKQATGQHYSAMMGRPLWQEGYHDRILRREDDVLSAARYIVWNPVRAGLVEIPADYFYVGSDGWALNALLEP